MKPRITLLTLAVENLERTVAFYRDGLGFETAGITGTEFEHGAVAFFQLEGWIEDGVVASQESGARHRLGGR